MRLIIGDRAYSTWSLRPWLILNHVGARFDETVIALNRPDTAARIAEHSPTGKVPALEVDGETIWDTLAIAMWAAERWPDLWPADPVARARAYAITCEMHSGFMALRTECGMGPDHSMVGPDRSPPPTGDAVAADVRRIVAIWRETRARFGAGGPYLFGRWSIADAFYTPVAARFRHFQIDLAAHGDDGLATAYRDTALSQPGFLAWAAKAGTD